MTNLKPPSEMTDAELELHIKHCGKLMEECYQQGNTEAAHGWMQLMNQAIAMRSPNRVQEMETALGLGEPCYFYEEGGKARDRLLERQER